MLSAARNIPLSRVGVLKGGTPASLPPRALVFHSPSVVCVNVLPVRRVNITSNLSTTKRETWSKVLEYTTIPKGTGQGHMCMHSARPRHGSQRTTDTYREDIPAVSVHQKWASDNCYQITRPTLLMYSSGDIPQDSPTNCMMSPDHVVFVYIASSQLANQSSVSNQPISVWNLIRPCPPWGA